MFANEGSVPRIHEELQLKNTHKITKKGQRTQTFSKQDTHTATKYVKRHSAVRHQPSDKGAATNNMENSMLARTGSGRLMRLHGNGNQCGGCRDTDGSSVTWNDHVTQQFRSSANTQKN